MALVFEWIWKPLCDQNSSQTHHQYNVVCHPESQTLFIICFLSASLAELFQNAGVTASIIHGLFPIALYREIGGHGALP